MEDLCQRIPVPDAGYTYKCKKQHEIMIKEKKGCNGLHPLYIKVV
jgi:hypothetical protein